MKLKITEIADIKGFQKALDQCKGTVNIITPEGDVLNLKSKLSQLITINIILVGISKLSSIVIYTESEQDAENLARFITKEV